MTEFISETLKEKIERLRLVVFDVDGTLTDGTVFLGSGGLELKAFNIQDGLGIKRLVDAGLVVAFLTSRSSEAVERRARELSVTHVIQGAGDKKAALEELQRKLGISPAETAAMGDDLPDLKVFELSGLRLAVPDGAPEVRAAADWVAARPAGRGAARDACELILRVRGMWKIS